MPEPQFHSPVTKSYAPRSTGAITLRDESALAKTIVRADIGTAAKAHLAVAFGASRESDGVLIAGTRPDEWMLIGSVDTVGAKADALPTEGHVSLVDWTHGRAAFRITGERCRSALEKVCSIDWSDVMTPDGATLSASVAGVTCDIVRNDTDDSRSYLLLFDRSFGQYLFEVLLDASQEFGVSAA